MQTRNVLTIFRKELKDTLRDRRTLIFMLLVPLVAMPLMMTGISKLMFRQVRKLETEKSIVAFKGMEQLPLILQDSLRASPVLTIKNAPDSVGGDFMAELKEGKIAALVVVSENFTQAIDLESTTDLEIYYDKAEDKSGVAVDKLEDVLDGFKSGVVETRLIKRNISTEILKPFETQKQNVASGQKVAGKRLGAILPYIIIIMCFLGAMYPAIDLAAGEKERGTLETLLVAPATRGEFVVGKYMVILSTGVVAGLLSMASMTYSMNNLAKEFASNLNQLLAIKFDVQTVILVLMIVLPLAGIFAAILLSLSIFAKSSKEAQGYMTFLNMFLIIPAFVAMLPGVELNFQTALIPIANISLIIREAISGSIKWPLILTAFFSTAIIASVALFFAKKWFEREEVLFRM